MRLLGNYSKQPFLWIFKLKDCKRCAETKPLTSYYKDKKAKDGLRGFCKDCEHKGRDLVNDATYAVNRRLRRCAKDMIRYKLDKMLINSRVRDKKKRLPNNLTLEYLIEKFSLVTHCPVFGYILDWQNTVKGASIPTSPSLDAIDPLLGHVMGNVQVISWLANTMKWNSTPDELRMFGKWCLALNT
jgi:hypothetical protein